MAVRLDPFRRIQSVGWPLGFALPYLDRVFVSNVLDQSVAPVTKSCPGNNPPGGYQDRVDRTSQTWIFHFRATPSSPDTLVQRVETINYDRSNCFVCASPSERAVAYRSVVMRYVSAGHTHAALSAFAFTEVSGGAFLIPNSENPLAWPQPDWTLTGLAANRILIISHAQRRDRFPGEAVAITPMRWDQYLLNPGTTTHQSSPITPFASAPTSLFNAPDLFYQEGADNVDPGLDQTYRARWSVQMLL
jgi:hypothetical protein